MRVLACFVAAEWIAVLLLGLAVRHNGWVYYQGGDQLWFYTLGWSLAHGHLGPTPVGYGWSILLAPIAAIAGPNLVAAFPAIILLDVLVLLPIAMLSVYGIAVRLAGRLFGYWTLLVWLVLPFLGILYTLPGYHERYTEATLPQSLGLTAMSDFPSMVAAVVSLYFCSRVLFDRTPALVDAAAAGVAGGFAIGIKPATTFFLVGPALVFLLRRYRHYGLAFVAGLLPAVIALAVWKARGLGNLPILQGAPRPPAGVAAITPVLGLGLSKYFGQLYWWRLANNIDLLREHFWSGHFVIWLFLAGLVGILRRSPRAFLLIGGAILPFTLAKASYNGASVEDASAWRLLMPCYPGFLLAVASLPFVVPRLPQRVPRPEPREPRTSVRTRRWLVGAAIAVTAVVPVVAFAATPPVSAATPTMAMAMHEQMPIPINRDVGASVNAPTVAGAPVLLRWSSQDAFGGRVFYRVWRARDTPSDGVSCTPTPGAPTCQITMKEIGVTMSPSYADKPPPGRWVYRIAVAANWLDSPEQGDPYLVSAPLHVRVP